MKRTPLKSKTGFKPRTKPMNRGKGLSRVSKTNSRPGIDEAFGRAYCLRPENRMCELLGFFPTDGRSRFIPLNDNNNGNKQKVPLCQYGSDPHHIFGGTLGKSSNRFDKVWNLVHVSRIVHLFADRFQREAAVLAITVKIRKGEWNREEATELLKFDPIGWLQLKPIRLAWVIPLWKSLIEKGSA